MAIRLVFLRHGHTTIIPDNKEVLSEQGIRSAINAGRTLRGSKITHVAFSHVRRTIQTAEAIGQGLAAEAGEFPDDQHQTLEALTTPCRGLWGDYLKSHPIPDFRHPFVATETARMVAEFDPVVRRLPSGSCLLSVGHSNLLECLVYGLTGYTLAPVRNCEGGLLMYENRVYRFLDEYRTCEQAKRTRLSALED